MLGARPREVGAIDPDLQKNYLIALNERKSQLEGYEITIEATHHGPTSLRRPVLFVELGSTEKQWGDAHAAEVIADALMASLASGKKWDKVALAFGGTHYPQKFNKVLLEGEYALSAVVDEALPRVDRRGDVRAAHPEDLEVPPRRDGGLEGRWAAQGKDNIALQTIRS